MSLHDFAILNNNRTPFLMSHQFKDAKKEPQYIRPIVLNIENNNFRADVRLNKLLQSSDTRDLQKVWT